jgi:thiol:disulfide interchange protein DsbC
MTHRFATALMAAVCFGALCMNAPCATAVAAPAAGTDINPATGQPANQAGGANSSAMPAADAQGGDKVTDAIKDKFSQRFAAQVTAVRRTPYSGVFEVQIGMDLVYTDQAVTWVMQGPLIDAMTRRDVTAERLQQLSHVDFDKLPLNLAVKEVNGAGKRRIAIFADPNCVYCKQLHKTLEKVDDLTVYTFLLPILTPDSKVKVKNVWCAADRTRVWNNWMRRGIVPPTVADCAVPVDQWMALARKLMVKGTPAIFFTDGSRADGALDLDQLTEKLQSIK